MSVPTRQTGDQGGSSDPQTQTPPTGGAGATSQPSDQGQGQGSQQVDLKSLSGEELNPLLENPNLWKTDRIQELVKANQELKELKEQQQKQADDKLKDDKKFEELATQKEKEAQELRQSLEKVRVDQSLTTLLYKEGVIDLDAALALVDRSGLELKDTGVEGTEKAIEKLKTDKAYLFGSNGNGTQLGTSSNNQGNEGNNQPSKFKRSQLKDPQFYAANREEILKAMKAGLIEDDLS